MSVLNSRGRFLPNHISDPTCQFVPDDNDPMNLQKSTRMGVEVEVEFENEIPPNKDFKFWFIVTDGSLRNGIEYITRLGMTYGQLDRAIKELQKYLSLKDVNFSERTSVHMHFDVSAIPMEDIKFLVAVYMFVEDILYSLVNKLRKHNIYCKPLGSLKAVSEHLKRNGDLPTRYTGLNLKAVREHTSVEFRFMHGSLAEKEILNWARVICNLLTYVRTHLWSHFYKAVNEITTKEQYIELVQQILGDIPRGKIEETLTHVVDFRELVYMFNQWEGM